MALGEHEVLSKSEGNRRLWHGKTEKSLPPREAVEVSRSSRRWPSHAQRKSTLLNGINRRLSHRMSPLFGARNSGPRFQSGYHSTLLSKYCDHTSLYRQNAILKGATSGL